MNLTKEKTEKSLTRVKLYWKTPQNGNTYMTFYSLDTRANIINNNNAPGIKGIEDRILKNPKYIGRYKFAILYNNQGNKEKIFEYNPLGRRV